MNLGLSEAWHRLAGLRRALLFVLVTASVYGWYVAVHWTRINEFNQRELGQGARILEAAVANAVTNVENLTPKGIPGFLAEQPYVRQRGNPGAGCTSIGEPKLTSNDGKGLFITAESGKDCKLTLEFDTSRLFSELSFQDAFSSIFLVDGKGKVISQFSDLRRSRQQGLRWIETAARPAVELAGTVRLSDLSQSVNSTQQEFAKIKGASANLRAVIGGEYHVIYLTPIRFSVGSTAEFNDSWVLGAIVPQQHLLRNAFAVDTYFLGAIVVVALGVCLGWPLLKLTTMAVNERLRKWDVYRIYLSTASVLTLVSVLIFSLEAYWQFNSAAAAGLGELSAQLESNLAAEVKAALDQLQQWDDIYRSHQVPGMVCLDLQARTSEEPCSLFEPPRVFANVQQVTWLKPTGMQAAKVTTDKSGADLIDVSHRPYFSSIAEDLVWNLKGGDSRPFYLHPLRSITDGQFYTFLSTASKVPLNGKASTDSVGRPSVVVMTLDLSSLAAQPLPAGYGFALVNRQGDVLYHSDPRLSLRQNIFEEVEGAAGLRALIVSGEQGAISTEYRSRQYEFHSRPVTRLMPRHLIAEIPAWYLVTFRDLSIPRAVAIRTVVAGLIGLFFLSQVLLGIALLAMAAVSKRFLGRAGAWLWPQQGQERSYVWMSMLLGVLWVMALWIPSLRVPVTLLVPWIAVGIRSYQVAHSAGVRDRGGFVGGWHLLSLALLGVHISVFPAFYMFQLGWNHEFSKLLQIERERTTVSRDDLLTEARVNAVRHEVPQSQAVLMKRERDRFLVKPFAPFAKAERFAEDNVFLLGPYQWLTRKIPVQTVLDGRFGHSTGLRGSRVFTAGNWFTGISVTVLLGLFVAWVRTVGNRLFLPRLAVEASEAHTPEGGWERCWEELSDGDRLVVMQALDEGVANPKQAVRVADLVRRGILTFEPDLQPVSGLRSYVANHRPTAEAVRQWESIGGETGWKQTRWVLIAGVAVVSIFLFVTQPALPGEISGFIAFMTTIATGVIKVREHLGGWLKPEDASAAKKAASAGS
ncbi:MAG: hypothetical protein U0Q16_28455 [Bryobacteraceae bacterium]